jgi:outer membrane immunogenic protein
LRKSQAISDSPERVRFGLRHFLDETAGWIVPGCRFSVTSFMSTISYLLRQRGLGIHAGGRAAAVVWNAVSRHRHEAYLDRERRCARRWGTSTRSRPPTADGAAAARAGCPADLQLDRLYIGGNAGAGWNSGGSVSDTLGSTFTGSGQTTKFIGGGQVGVNYEFGGGVVVGAEAMFDWLPDTTNTWNATNGANTASATFNSRWVTTATGKLGYAWDRVLVYGKGGGAWVGANNPNATVNGAGVTLSSSTTNNFGWTAGVGVEWAFAGNWSARAEYDYIGLQNQSVTVGAGNAFAGDTINLNNRAISMFTAGLNYKFGGGWW